MLMMLTPEKPTVTKSWRKPRPTQDCSASEGDEGISSKRGKEEVFQHLAELLHKYHIN
jgi:hypothetical protein